MTCALGRAWPWTGPKDPGPGPTLLAGADFKFWNSCAQNKVSEISNITLSGFLGLLCAEQHVGNLKNCTFRNYGSPVRSTKRRKSQEINVQEFWDSCAQNKTSDVSKNAIIIYGTSGRRTNVRNIEKCTLMICGTTVRRTERHQYRQCTFINYETPVCKTKRRKSKQKDDDEIS